MTDEITLGAANLLDRAGGHQVGAGPRIKLTGPNQLARRFIHPPEFAWEPVGGAARYRISLAQDDRLVGVLETDRPTAELAELWPRIEAGPCRWIVQALDADGGMLAHSVVFGFTRARPFTGAVAPARAGYAATARRNLEFLLSRTGLNNYDPGLPPYVWQCTIDNDSNSVARAEGHSRAFPAIHLPAAIDCFLDYRRHASDARLRDACLAEAKVVADWVIAHSTPPTDRYAYLPYQCVSDGRVGLHGGKPVDDPEQAGQNLVEPNKSGYMGVSFLHLHDASGEERYLAAARRIGQTLLTTQLPAGNWLYRVHATTGEARGEEYTSTVVFALMLMDELERRQPDGTYREGRRRAEAWLLDNPLTTFRWENIFDDTRYVPNYANTGNYDALFAGRYLLAHRDEDPRFLPLAERLFRWVDDNFVLYGPDPWVPFRPHTPSVTEQWHYYWPMAGHNANWLLFLLRLHETTGREEYRQRAIGAANVITQCALADGRTTTYVPDALLGARAQRGADDWFGDTFWSISALLAAAERLEEPRVGSRG
jgi:hypothetical protein